MDQVEAVKKIAELMKDTKICTMSSISDGEIVSRPMAVQSVEFDGDVWFFTYDTTDKITEIKANPNVNIAFESKNSWVSLSGRAELIHDRQKAAELWNPMLKAWFPKELDEPGLALLKIHALSAEYWDSSSSKMVSLFGSVKAAITGKAADGGENKTVVL
jgi:general stress protein 26